MKIKGKELYATNAFAWEEGVRRKHASGCAWEGEGAYGL